MSQNKTVVTALALALYAVFLGIAAVNDVAKYYFADAVFFALVIIFLHATFSFWRLTIPLYTLVVLGFATHLMGILGWYSVSPIPLQWDHVTHGVPMFTLTAVLYSFMRPWLGRFWSGKTWAILFLVLLGGLGLGSVVENIEYLGYLTFGHGEGALFLGGPGDGLPLTSEQLTDVQEFGGGYINTEVDLVWNLFGTVAALLVMSLIHFRKRAP